MNRSPWPFALGIITLACLAGLLAGFNMFWLRHPPFPLYGWLVDVCAVPVMVWLFLLVRRLKRESSDEFSVAKKRHAAQIGFIVGFVTFALSGLIPVLMPDLYRGFIASLDGAGDGFIFGRIAGMAPFVIGLVAGQIYTWMKYR